MGKYSTVRVPHETPMYELGADGRQHLSRTWMIFFERLKVSEAEAAAGAAGLGPFTRTLLLKDTTEGNDIADHTTVYADGIGTRIVGVLRRAIIADLQVRLNKDGTAIITLNIPYLTPIDTPVESSAFTSTPMPFTDGEVLTWDVTNSDGSKDRNGVAALTVEWAPAPAAPALARMRFATRTR